ncbi:MAG: MBL fold metallo-hydrolase [Lentisphaeria bacterium]|nr:MBL fold metallo-hydrolase [Lentisphaeria bacterium]
MERPKLSCCALVAEGLLRITDEKAPCISHGMNFDGGRVVQFRLGIMSAYSYLLSSCGSGLLIDPVRELGNYSRYLDEHGIRLEGVFLTHMHADFVAGHIEASERYKVPVFIPRGTGAGFSHIPVGGDSEFRLGRLTLRFFSAAGSACDDVCLAVGTTAGDPALVFIGDAAEGTERRSPGPDWLPLLSGCGSGTRFYPAHETDDCGEGWFSLDGMRRRFLARTGGPVPPPERTCRIGPRDTESLRIINRSGPPVVDWENPYAPETPDISEAAPRSRVVDVRNAARYASGHIPFSLNIESNGRLEYWAGALFDPLDGALIVTGGNGEEIADAGRRLRIVGFDVCGFPFSAWKRAGFPVRRSSFVSAPELARALESDGKALVLDVRTRAEWECCRIARSVNIPLRELQERVGEVCSRKIAAVVCASGYLSAIAAGILERCGGRDVCRLTGGVGSWIEEGFPVVRGRASRSHA